MFISVIMASQIAPIVCRAAGGAPMMRRYKQLSCAIVRVSSDIDGGTGFFVTSNGVLVTAAHVIFEKTFHQENDKIILSLKIP